MMKKYENLEEYVSMNKTRLELNEAIVTENFSKVSKLDERLKEELKVFNTKITSIQYEELLLDNQTNPENVNPILAAITAGTIINFSTKQNKETGEYEYKEKQVIIDLLALDKTAKRVLNSDNKRLFNNDNWALWLEKLNHAIYKSKLKSFEITKVSDNLESFKVSESCKGITMNLGSIKGQTKALQEVVDAIIFTPYIDKDGKETDKNNYKVLTKHTKALLETYAKFSNKKINSIVMARDARFRQDFMRILHVIICNKEFEAE